MNITDKLVTEWAFRCKKGYPDMNNPEDLEVLREIYAEYGIIMEADEDSSSKDRKQRTAPTKLPLAQYHGQYIPIVGKTGEKLYVKKEDFDEKTKQVKPNAKYYKLEPKGKGAGIYQNIYKEVPPTTGASSQVSKTDSEEESTNNEKAYVAQQLDKAGIKPDVVKATQENPLYRTAKSVEEFVKSGTLSKYIDAFKYLYPYQVLKGGKGEFVPFVSISGAKLGGPNEKDITDKGGKVLEVKELTGKGQKREFALASGASIAGSQFITNLQTFIKAVAPYDDIPQFRGITNLQSYDSINSGYLDDLRDVLENFPYTEEDLTDKAQEIKINGKKYSIKKGVQYAIELDDEGNVKPIENAPVESKVADINLRKLLNHPWVKKESSPMGDLEIIRQNYFKSVNYLMLWTSDSTAAIIDTSNSKQTDLIPVNRVATGNLSLSYYMK